MAQQTETLSSYRTRLLRELRDAGQNYYNNQGSATPNLDLNAWINEGIRWRDLWSGGSRSYRAQVALTTGLDQYDLTVLFPNDTVLDIINLWLIYGNVRIPLSESSLGDVTAKVRPLVSYNNIPAMFCRYGAFKLFIATAPAGSYTADFDVAVLSGTLVNDAGADPLPYPYTEPVPKYAAYLAKQNQARFDEADMFYNQAVRSLQDIEGSRAGMLPQMATR